MSGLQLDLIPFLNLKRPILQHFSVTVRICCQFVCCLTQEQFAVGPAQDPELSSQLESSLKVSVSNGPACAASARLWEDLLERYHIPYLLLLVTDMRTAKSPRWRCMKRFVTLTYSGMSSGIFFQLEIELNDKI